MSDSTLPYSPPINSNLLLRRLEHLPPLPPLPALGLSSTPSDDDILVRLARHEAEMGRPPNYSVYLDKTFLPPPTLRESIAGRIQLALDILPWLLDALAPIVQCLWSILLTTILAFDY